MNDQNWQHFLKSSPIIPTSIHLLKNLAHFFLKLIQSFIQESLHALHDFFRNWTIHSWRNYSRNSHRDYSMLFPRFFFLITSPASLSWIALRYTLRIQPRTFSIILTRNLQVFVLNFIQGHFSKNFSARFEKMWLCIIYVRQFWRVGIIFLPETLHIINERLLYSC